MKSAFWTVLFSFVLIAYGESYSFPEDAVLFGFKPEGKTLIVKSPEISGIRGYFKIKKELSSGVYLARMKYRLPGEKVLLDCYIFNDVQDPKNAGLIRFRASSEWEETAGIIRLTRPGMPRFSFVCNKTRTILEEYYKHPGNLEIQDLEIIPLKSDPLVANGDFRYGITMPAGWMPSPGGLVVPVRVPGDNGNSVMRVENRTDKVQHVYSSSFPLEQKRYRVSFEARAQGGNSTLTLRIVDWNWKWSGGKISRTLGPDWKKYSAEFDVPKAGPAFADFWCGPGTGEIRNFRIEQAAGGKKTAAAPVSRYPWIAPGKSTLIHNGNFNAGMTGWCFFLLGGAQMPEVFAAKFMCGRPEIRMEAGNPYLFLPRLASVRSWEIPYIPGRPVRVSFRAKASKAGPLLRVGVSSVNWAGASAPVKLGTEWETYDFSLTLRRAPYRNRIFLNFSPSGDVCIDDVVVYQGETPERKFDPVSLGISGGSLLDKGKTDVALKLTATPSADFGACRVKLTAQDIFGRKAWERNWTLRGNKKQTWEFPVKVSEPGFWTLKAEVTDASGRNLGNGFGRYMVMDPLTPEEFEKAEALAMCYFFPPDAAWVRPLDMRVFKAVGAKYLPMVVYRGWYKDRNPYHGKLAPIILQTYLPELRKWKDAGFKIIIRVGLDDFYYVEKRENRDPTEKEIKEELQSVCQLLDLYRDVIYGVAYAGEVNIWRLKSGEYYAPPERVMKFIRGVLPELRKRYPELKFYGPAVCGTDSAYTKKLIDLGAHKFFDKLGLDAYRHHPDTPVSTYREYETIQRYAEKAGFHGGYFNLEQNFCMDNVLVFDNESIKSYTASDEFEHAVWYAHSFIQQAAWEIPWSHFIPSWTLYAPMTFEGGCPFMALAAISAGHKQIVGAGRGYEIFARGPVKMYLFPKAAKGPVLAVFSTEKDTSGRLQIPGFESAVNFVGTPIKVEAAGIRITEAPVYLQFRPGFPVKDLPSKIKFTADHAGPAFTGSVAVMPDRILIKVANMRMEKVKNVRLELDEIPSGLELARKVDIGDFEPYGEKTLTVPLKEFKRSGNGKYRFAVSVHADGSRTRWQSVSAPVFAEYTASREPDWNRAKWAHLDIASPDNLIYSQDAAFRTKKLSKFPLSADYSVQWNERGIYLAVRVKGSERRPPKEPANMYKADSLQVYFDQLNDASAANYDQNDIVYQIGECGGKAVAWLEKAPSGRFVGANNQENGIDSMVEVKIKPEGNTVLYRVFFPKTVLPHAGLKAGNSLGFALFIHDLTPENILRGIGLTAAPPYRRPDTWCDLILLPAAKP